MCPIAWLLFSFCDSIWFLRKLPFELYPVLSSRKYFQVYCVVFKYACILMYQAQHHLILSSYFFHGSVCSGYVDFTEWYTFLANVQTDRMNYYKTKFLLKVGPLERSIWLVSQRMTFMYDDTTLHVSFTVFRGVYAFHCLSMYSKPRQLSTELHVEFFSIHFVGT